MNLEMNSTNSSDESLESLEENEKLENKSAVQIYKSFYGTHFASFCFFANENVQIHDEFHWTGHPFVDAGLATILLYSGKEKPEELNSIDVRKTIEFVVSIYLGNEWTRYLTRIFRNNNPILMINTSMRKNRTLWKLRCSLWNLSILSSFNKNDSKCQVCGENEKISGLDLRQILHTKDQNKPKEVAGDIFPLLGTGEARNFFPSANFLGADLCAQCLFLSQLMPISTYGIKNKNETVVGVLLIYAYPYANMMELLRESMDCAKYQSLFSDSREFKRPENFFFRKVIEITRKVEAGSEFWKDTTITLYYFINGNRSGEQWIKITHIPTSTLSFIAFAGEKDYLGWKNILNKGWKIEKSKKQKISFKELEKGFFNRVYSKLLNGESILSYFYNQQEKTANTKWRLLEFYCLEVLGLNKETLDFIKDVGDRIVKTVEPLPDNQLRKTIREIENAKWLYQFGNFFIRLEKIRQQKGLPDAFLSFDEFSMLLTGYGEELDTSWFTVRSLLLFRLYEKLHNRLTKIDLEEIEEEAVDEMPFGGE